MSTLFPTPVLLAFGLLSSAAALLAAIYGMLVVRRAYHGSCYDPGGIDLMPLALLAFFVALCCVALAWGLIATWRGRRKTAHPE